MPEGNSFQEHGSHRAQLRWGQPPPRQLRPKGHSSDPSSVQLPAKWLFGAIFPFSLMTINTWKAKSGEETTETSPSRAHLFSPMCTGLLWRPFEAAGFELPLSEGRGFLLCLIFLPLAHIYHSPKMKRTLLFRGSDQDSRNKGQAE